MMGTGWLVYELSDSALMLGYLGAAAGIPAIATTLFGGVLADRIDKRLLLIVTSIATSMLLALLAYLDFAEIVEVWHVILITAGISVVTGFDWPARQAIFPALIERDDMMSAVALTSIIWQSSRMVMPAFGGIIIAISDTWLLFVLCSVGFLLMFFVLLGIKAQNVISTAVQSTLGQIEEGVRFILGEKTFLLLISLSYAIYFFASSYMYLMPAFVELLNVKEQGYGYILSVTGVGSVAGTAISASLQNSRHLGTAMLSAALTFCLFIYCFAALTFVQLEFVYLLALATVFCAAIFLSIFMVTSTTIMQLKVPNQLRGRVMGFQGMTYNMLPLGGLFVGYLASLLNAPMAIAISTSIFVIFVVWVLLTQDELRQIDGRELSTETA